MYCGARCTAEAEVVAEAEVRRTGDPLVDEAAGDRGGRDVIRAQPELADDVGVPPGVVEMGPECVRSAAA